MRIVRGIRRVATAPARRREAAEHRRRALAFYGALVREGDLCFDIGANRGNRTAVLLELGARVVALEPQPACVAELAARFGTDARFTLLPVGVSDAPGMRVLHLGDVDTVSTMSAHFQEEMRGSGRFGSVDWSGRMDVRVTSLDALIEVFGVPAYCKIDVEGHERAVVSGLGAPVPLLSFETTPELLDDAAAILEHLSALGEYEFAYTEGESLELTWGWVDRADALDRLSRLRAPQNFGDVLARLGQGAGTRAQA